MNPKTPLSNPKFWMIFILILLGRINGNSQQTTISSLVIPQTKQNVPGGDFENPAIPITLGYKYGPENSKWDFTGCSGYSLKGSSFTSGTPDTEHGEQVLFIQGNGEAHQKIELVAGTYVFSIKAIQRCNGQINNQAIELRIDGDSIDTITPQGICYKQMDFRPVALASDSHTVMLRGVNPNGGDNTAFLDMFTYKRLPEILLDGFESPVITNPDNFSSASQLGDWTFTSGGGIARNNSGMMSGNIPLPNSEQALFLQCSGTAKREINIEQDGYYRFHIHAALRGNMQNQNQPVRMLIGQTNEDTIKIGEFPLLSTSFTEFVTTAIYLKKGTYDLFLEGTKPVLDDHTALVDSLSIEQLLDWGDSLNWVGRKIPKSNDIVSIPEGSRVVMSDSMYADSLQIKGEFLAVQNKNFFLEAGKILVKGKLEIGHELAPYPSEGSIVLTEAPTPFADLPEEGPGPNENFLMASMGGTMHIHGKDTLGWTQLKKNVAVGGTKIILKDLVPWEAGDSILIVSSRLDWNEAEKREISEVIEDTVKFLVPLNFPHCGAQKTYTKDDKSWTADLRAEVGLLTRNIKIEGKASTVDPLFGGHIMIMGNAKGYLSGVELYNMGQGGRMARYPFHWHMIGDKGNGQYIKNSSIHKSNSRGVTIHGTDSVLVAGNFIYDHFGHGIFLEDGVEQNNIIRKNVVLHTKKPEESRSLLDSDSDFDELQNRSPASYWITNPNNSFEDNVAAGTEGTGYWFAFPESAMGKAKESGEYAALHPNKLDLKSFKGNTAHSCKTGLDIFDGFDEDEKLLKNSAWENSNIHLIEDCLWYADSLAIYTGTGGGGPTNNLIFSNNALVENRIGLMLASNSIVNSAVIVFDSEESLVAGNKYAYLVYDGPGQVRNSHFVGWDTSDANLWLNSGAGTKHVNHIFEGNTTDHTGRVRCTLPDFDPVFTPGKIGPNDPRHPRVWSIAIRDKTGEISGIANSTILSNHPFLLVGDEPQPPNWERTYRSNRKYGLAILSYTTPVDTPNVSVTREKENTPTESVYYVNGYQEHHQLPVILNENFTYTYAYEDLPSDSFIRLQLMDTEEGDTFIARFKHFGNLNDLDLKFLQQSLPEKPSFESLGSAQTSSYYKENGGDLWVKIVAEQDTPVPIAISWSPGNYTLPTLDTDGDQMTDALEISSNRDPVDASDLKADFSMDNDCEGWTPVNVESLQVINGILSGTSHSSGDASFQNAEFNFDANSVDKIEVRMKASSSSRVDLFFSTAGAPGYNSLRMVSSDYTGTDTWETIVLNLKGHSAWSHSTITGLRLDPVLGTDIDFEIDWIKACTPTPQKTDQDGTSDMNRPISPVIYPNPFSEELTIDLGVPGLYESIQLVDVQGRVLISEQITPAQSYIQWTLPKEEFPIGIYFLTLEGEGGSGHFRIVKGQ